MKLFISFPTSDSVLNDSVGSLCEGIVPIGDQWKYDYDPNLGGKGQTVSIKSLNQFTDNIFDPKEEKVMAEIKKSAQDSNSNQKDQN